MTLRCLLGHQWRVHEEGFLSSPITRNVTGRYFILICAHCGAMKERRFK